MATVSIQVVGWVGSCGACGGGTEVPADEADRFLLWASQHFMPRVSCVDVEVDGVRRRVMVQWRT